MLFLSHCNSVPSPSILLRSVLPPSFYLPVSHSVSHPPFKIHQLHLKVVLLVSTFFAPLLTHTHLSLCYMFTQGHKFLPCLLRRGLAAALSWQLCSGLLPANGEGKADSKRSNHWKEWNCGVKQVAMLMGETGRQIYLGFLWNCSQTLISCKAVGSVFTSQVATTSGHAHHQCLGLCLRVANSDFTKQKAMPLCEEKKDGKYNYLQETTLTPRAWNKVSGNKCICLTSLWSSVPPMLGCVPS